MATATSNNTTAAPASRSPPKDVKHASATDTGKGATDPTSEPAPSAATDSKPAATEGNEDKKTANAPFAPPPPRTSQAGGPQNSSDYFGSGHNTAHFSLEPNPFEQSFGQPSDAPRSQPPVLPSVSSLTSPAPLGPGATPDWQNSLRVGPLSPAMLTGPTTANGEDYFNSTFRQSFPTPNESSMRSTGLTPGGPSMFPAPSPNSQALYNMPVGGATPGTLDFHRTAMNAKARSMADTQQASAQGVNKADYQPAQQASQSQFGQNNSESDAVNSLYMLANNGQRNPNQFSMPPQPQGGIAGLAQMRSQNRASDQAQSGHRSQHHSIGGMSGSTGSGMDGYASEGSVDARPSSKKGSKKAAKSSNGRRKQDDTPSKGPASKKSKGNSGAAQMPDMDDDEDEDDNIDHDIGPNGKKLTDEEKRKNFLERNRVAALKCRQRKKQWLANLQAKVEIFTTENDALTGQCASLREENQNLKALLLQHKDCAVSHSQGLGGNRMANVLGIGGDFDAPNPYMNMGQPGMMVQQHSGR